MRDTRGWTHGNSPLKSTSSKVLNDLYIYFLDNEMKFTIRDLSKDGINVFPINQHETDTRRLCEEVK